MDREIRDEIKEIVTATLARGNHVSSLSIHMYMVTHGASITFSEVDSLLRAMFYAGELEKCTIGQPPMQDHGTAGINPMLDCGSADRNYGCVIEPDRTACDNSNSQQCCYTEAVHPERDTTAVRPRRLTSHMRDNIKAFVMSSLRKIPSISAEVVHISLDAEANGVSLDQVCEYFQIMKQTGELGKFCIIGEGTPNCAIVHPAYDDSPKQDTASSLLQGATGEEICRSGMVGILSSPLPIDVASRSVYPDAPMHGFPEIVTHSNASATDGVNALVELSEYTPKATVIGPGMQAETQYRSTPDPSFECVYFIDGAGRVCLPRSSSKKIGLNHRDKVYFQEGDGVLMITSIPTGGGAPSSKVDGDGNIRIPIAHLRNSNLKEGFYKISHNAESRNICIFPG